MGTLKMTSDIWEKVFERLAEGRSLASICKDEDIPVAPSAIRMWLVQHPTHNYAARYATARDVGIEHKVDDLFAIGDDGTNDWMEKELKDGSTGIVFNKEAVMRSRLRCDNIKWYVSKLAPKRYGDRVTQDITSSDGTLAGMSNDQIAAKLNQILQSAQKRKEAVDRQSKPPVEEEDYDALLEEMV